MSESLKTEKHKANVYNRYIEEFSLDKWWEWKPIDAGLNPLTLKEISLMFDFVFNKVNLWSF